MFNLDLFNNTEVCNYPYPHMVVHEFVSKTDCSWHDFKKYTGSRNVVQIFWTKKKL